MNNAQMIDGRFLRWHGARRRLAWIQARVAEGLTVYLSTMTRATAIDARHLGMLSATKSGLYLATGAKRVCVTYCRLSAQ